MLRSKMLRRNVSLLALTVAGTALAAGGTPGANPTQAKYMTRSGVEGSMCAPSGALKDLVSSSKYSCYGPKGGDACGASLDAAKGSLDPKFTELFVDLLKKDPSYKTVGQQNRDGFLYAAGCSDLGGADFAHMLSFGGLSYGKAKADVLLAYGTADNFATWGAIEREAYIAALGRYGEPQKDKILPILRTALGTKGSMLAFKKNALKLMARFGSDDGVAYCLDVLRQGTDKDVGAVCGYYLGERKNTAAASVLIRHAEEHEEVFTRALGLMGNKEAVDGLRAVYEKQAGSAVAARVTVALANLGDKSYDYAGDLAAMSLGRRPLSLKDRERKAEELKKGKKGAADKWKAREAEEQNDVAQIMAIEATYLVDAAAGKKVDEALRVTAKRSDWAKASALATSALAQRGDKAASASLIKLLDHPKDEVREVAVGAFGASYDVPEAFTNYVGRKGIVVDSNAPAALVKYIENESKDERRQKGLRALGAVRSFLQ